MEPEVIEVYDDFSYKKLPEDFTGTYIVRSSTGKEALIICHYLNGVYHSEDGPAVIDYNFFKGFGVNKSVRMYFLHGKLLKKEQWFEQIPEQKKKEMVYKLDEL